MLAEAPPGEAASNIMPTASPGGKLNNTVMPKQMPVKMNIWIKSPTNTA